MYVDNFDIDNYYGSGDGGGYANGNGSGESSIRKIGDGELNGFGNGNGHSGNAYGQLFNRAVKDYFKPLKYRI